MTGGVFRVLSFLAVAVGLAGCATSGPLALAGTSGCGVVTAMRMAMAGLPCTAPKPPPAPYCTRSLGDADCWQDPARLPGHPPQIADGGWEASGLPQPAPTRPPAPAGGAPIPVPGHRPGGE
jgi:hypothetical protein